MCEQTEITYLDGDVVWVKLGSYWWPGQVIGIEKLSEDIQTEFKKKPLIAAVKFFQEDSFEFVKNYQQIYKYNCTQKEDFIKKGLDKYRTKSKDGSNYMDKFPEDVKTAEILTNGDPDILSNEKFNPKEKPDISGLFGEKKIIKKKRNRDDSIKKNDSNMRRKVTHPRFLQENDHEVRIRQQPKNLPTTSNSNFSAGIYPCHVCGFTTTRVNIIICHLKNHRLNKEINITMKSKMKASILSKSKENNAESSKRKYIRKSVSSKIQKDFEVEFGKRKCCKQVKKFNKEKSDSELREKLLADWNVDTDEDECIEKSINIRFTEKKDENNILKLETNENVSDSILFLRASNNLLQETDNLANLTLINDIPDNSERMEVEQNNLEKLNSALSSTKSKESFNFKKISIENLSLKEKDDKKSRLSCFDFDEDDIPEPSVSSVRKIPRSLGSKNLSLKKEIIKEFEMSQALKNEEESFLKNDEIYKTDLKINKQFITEENIQNTKYIKNNKLIVKEEVEEFKNNERLNKTIEACETHLEIVEIFEVEEKNIIKDVIENKPEKNNIIKVDNENIKLKFQDEDKKLKITMEELIKDNNVHEKIEKEIIKQTLQDENIETDLLNTDKINEIKKNENIVSVEEVSNLNSQMLVEDNNFYKIPVIKDKESLHSSNNKEIITEKFIVEMKDKNNLLMNNCYETNNSDLKTLSNLKSTLHVISDDRDVDSPKNNFDLTVKKRRGRPRKNSANSKDISSDNKYFKLDNLKKKIESEQVSESHLNCSYTVRRRKIKRKYQSSLYLQKFNSTPIPRNENLSESDDRCEEIKGKIKNKKDVKIENSKIDIKLIDKIKNWKSSINNLDNTGIGVNVKKNSITNNLEIKVPIKKHNNILISKNNSEHSKDDVLVNNNFSEDNENNKNDISTDIYNNLQEEKEIQAQKEIDIKQNINDEIVYSKKCQSKKFELSKVNFVDNNSVKCLNIDLNDELYNIFDERKNIQEDFKKSSKIQNEIPLKVGDINQVSEVVEKINFAKEKIENKILTKTITSSENSSNYNESYTGKHVSDISTILKKDKLDANQLDSFQDAFIKTLKIENSLQKGNISEIQTENKNIDLKDKKKLSITRVSMIDNLQGQSKITNFSFADKFDNMEVKNNKIEEKLEETVSIINDTNSHSSNNNVINIDTNTLVLENSVTKFKNLNKLDDLENSILVSPTTMDIKIPVPVKKREKPRIIENVTLKEPMILKTKLMEKHVTTIGKHKLDNNNLKTDEIINFPKTKIMKMETVISNNKNKSHISNGNNLTITKKLIKTLKSEDDSLIANSKNQDIAAPLSETISEVPCTEKCIQQSSQSLVDMDLDINSMPFVLSEDVLTPESIDQIPVLISSVLSSKIPVTTVSTTLIPPTKQVYNTNQLSKEIIDVCSKKKSGTPTILKNKNKTKPTITSIKTIVPPLTSATCKGNFKINRQALKKSVTNQKVPGKYVIVQTSGHQQAYSTHHKVAIPTSKGSGNAQIVQHGSKVVILTSPQSGQSGQKVLPLNSISKALNSGKVQRFMTSKNAQEMYKSISPQSFKASKTILTSSGDYNSSTTSKAAVQKILNQKQISNSILNQLPGSIAKSNILSTLPQGFLTKDGIFTPLKTSTLGGKTIVSSKTFVTKGFPNQTTNILKNTSIPITQSLSSKTIVNSQGIVSKGTILTPITGSQVKALAAKNVKRNKLQLDQNKIEPVETQKSPKVTISSSFIHGNTNLKTSSSVMVLQKTEFKTFTPNKKNIKQTIHKQSSATTILSPSNIFTVEQKGKLTPISIDKKINGPKNLNCSTKLQQKLFTEKSEENLIFRSTNIETSLQTKIIEKKRQILSVPIAKTNKDMNKNLNKKVSHLTNSAMLLPSNISNSFSITVPSLELEKNQKIPKKDQISEQISLKKEINSKFIEEKNIIEPKVNVQSQIMALPTENNDGTQTYVLVTVDEQGHIIPLDNSALMSLDEASNSDGSRTLYIDSNYLTESESVENIVLQLDNESLTNVQSENTSESGSTIITENLSSSEMTLTTNQDILAAALANSDFQHEIGVTECSSSAAMSNLTQTILQSTIIPPTEPISSPLVLETSLTLNQPIMTPLEVPSSISVQPDLTPVSSTTIVPTSITLPITDDNQSISYITTTEPLLQITNNSITQIKKPIKSTSLENTVDTKISSDTQSIIESNLVEQINNNSQIEPKSISNVSYSFSIDKNKFDKKQIQTTPSMPIIDDSFNANNGFDSTNTSVIENNLSNFVTKTSEELLQDLTGNDSQENNESLKNITNDKMSIQDIELKTPQIILNDIQHDCVSSQQSISSNIEQSEKKITSKHYQSLNKNKEKLNSNKCINEEACVVSSESSTDDKYSHKIQSYVVAIEASKDMLVLQESRVPEEEKCPKLNKELSSEHQSESLFSNLKSTKAIVDIKKIIESKDKNTTLSHISNILVDDKSNEVNLDKCKITFINEKCEIHKETQTQSYEKFVSITRDIAEVPNQCISSNISQETAQPISYQILETDINISVENPSKQFYEDSKQSANSYKTVNNINVNTPAPSFDEIMEVNQIKTVIKTSIDDSSFPTQSYEVEKKNLVENMEIETEIGLDGNNSPQSNDIGIDGISTTSISTNHLSLNEDETASSSYVPETPENQERDQDQESAISTSSYEIPPCEELNIASSSIIPDTSVQLEHSSIHNNGVPEIPSSSYNLNPDSNSTQTELVPTANFKNQIIVEQSVSTSYEIPISINNLEETGSHSYINDCSNERNETTSYYSHHQEVTESYYESMCKQSKSRLQTNSEEEATSSYYENNSIAVTSEGSPNYFNQEESTTTYTNDVISTSYYGPGAHREASQTYYSTVEINRPNEIIHQNIEATPSFYQENSNEQQLHQQGQTIPTYTDRYSLDYVPVSSPLDRHDLVGSSVSVQSMNR